MYSFLIPPSPGTVDRNPVPHTVHNSVKNKPPKSVNKTAVKRSPPAMKNSRGQ